MRHYYIKKLRFSGYRKFGPQEQALEFAYPDLVNDGSGLNIIVGAISSGKTSLLEMIGWISGLGFPDLDRMIINDGLPPGDVPNISAEWIAPTFDQDPEITYDTRSEIELLGRQLRGSLVKSYPDDKTGESYPNEGQLIKFIRPNRIFSGMVRNSGPALHESSDRENRGDTYNLAGIVNYFLNPPISGITVDHFNEWIKKYAYLGIEIENIRISEPPRSGDPLSHFEAKLTGGEWHNVQDLSDGTKELLWWIFELHFGDTNNFRIVCIDEIERSIHPQIQTKILEMIKQRSRHQQFFITTHSTYIANPHIAQKIHRISKSGIVKTAQSSDFQRPSIFNVDHNRIFFADDVLFVEGVDDHAYFSEKMIEYGYEELVTRLFFANSKNNIDFFELLCGKLGINFHAIVDDDFSDKVGQLSSGNHRMMERVINKLDELSLLKKDDINLNELDKQLAGSPRIEATKKAKIVDGKHYRKVTSRNIYPLMHGKLENYQIGKNRVGKNVEAEQEAELRDIFEVVRG